MTTPAKPAPATTTASLLGPADWAIATAHRLRYLQASFADDPRDSREAFLEEELKKLLEPVPVSKRQEYLNNLAEKFPTWESITTSAETNRPSAESAPQTPDDIWTLFQKTLPRFSLEQREQIKKRLADAGFVKLANDSLDPETTSDIVEKLKLTPSDKIDPARLGKLFAALADLAIMTDQLAWNIWKNLAPKSTLRRDGSAGDLRTALRRSVTGDTEVSATQIARQLEHTRQLIAGLIAAIGPAGKTFARRHQTRYAPEAIRDMVKLEGSSIFGNPDARYWKKYTELAQEISEDSIQTDMIDAVAKYAEDLMRGQNR